MKPGARIRHAFTVLELLVVMIIILLLSALLFSTLPSMKREARVSDDLSRLRQLHLSIKLYQSENDGDGKYGFASQMGLMPIVEFYVDRGFLRVNSNVDLWRSPCGEHPMNGRSPCKYDYFPDNVSAWSNYVTRLEDDSAILADRNCNDANANILSSSHPIRIVYVSLGGTAKSVFKTGEVSALGILP